MSIHITSLPTLALGILLCGGFAPVSAQRTLTLEECRNLALQNNKELKARKLGQQDAAYAKKAARTNYLPKVDVVANYTWTSKEISLLDKDQKAAFANLGTNTISGLTNTVTSMVQNGLLTQEQAANISQQLGKLSGPITQIGNQLGQQINDAFRTDTRNIFSVQPRYASLSIWVAPSSRKTRSPTSDRRWPTTPSTCSTRRPSMPSTTPIGPPYRSDRSNGLQRATAIW